MKDALLQLLLLSNEINSIMINVHKMLWKKEYMKNLLYASVVCSLMYAQICTSPDTRFAVGMLRRY